MVDPDVIFDPEKNKPLVELPAEQERAVQAILASPSMMQAADACGVGRTTLYRWLKDPDFAARLREARHQLMRHGIHRLHQFSEDAALTLHSVMVDPDASAAARVSAARSLLSLSYEGYEIDQIDEKILEVDEARRAIAEGHRNW